MSIHRRADRDGWQVKWREGGHQRSRSFRTEADARAFDRKLRERKRERGGRRALREVGPERKARQQVYVIGDADYVKIGVSADPMRRLSGMQTGSPRELRPLWLITTPDAIRLEGVLHTRYEAHRTRGEWYTAAPVLADLAVLAQLGICQFQWAADPAVPLGFPALLGARS